MSPHCIRGGISTDTALVFPNAIEIRTLHQSVCPSHALLRASFTRLGQYFFSSFLVRDQAYRVLIDQWRRSAGLSRLSSQIEPRRVLPGIAAGIVLHPNMPLRPSRALAAGMRPTPGALPAAADDADSADNDDGPTDASGDTGSNSGSESGTEDGDERHAQSDGRCCLNEG